MDQDGNTAMPQKPDFSSPNSTDAGQQQIAAAAASMTESDPKQAITSSSSDDSQARGMFGNRRFKAKKDAAPTSFAGAPDFFNQAAGENQDFVTIGDAPASSNKKRFIIIGVIIVAIVGVVAAIFLLNPTKLGGGGNADFSKEEKQKIVELYDDYTLLLQYYRLGREKPSEQLKERIQKNTFSLIDPYIITNYNKTIPLVRNRLSNIRDVEQSSGVSEQKKTALKNMTSTIEHNIDVMTANVAIMEKFKAAFDDPASQLMEGEKKPTSECELSEEARKLSDGDSKESIAAQKYSTAYCELNTIIYTGQAHNKDDTIASFVEAKKALADAFEDISGNIIDTTFLKSIKDGMKDEK